MMLNATDKIIKHKVGLLNLARWAMGRLVLGVVGQMHPVQQPLCLSQRSKRGKEIYQEDVPLHPRVQPHIWYLYVLAPDLGLQ